MAQAKTLTPAELDQVLRYVSTTRFPQRDRALLFTSFWSGMRVGEIAALKMGDVIFNLKIINIRYLQLSYKFNAVTLFKILSRL